MMFVPLDANPEGSQPLQQWAAKGLPVPPSWSVDLRQVAAMSHSDLLAQLDRLMDADASRYWVLQQGRVNAQSQRENLLTVDSTLALASALQSLTAQDPAMASVVIQALPARQATGVLFTRHPLRQDLPHMVIEGVVPGDERRQKLIYAPDGGLQHQALPEHPLNQRMPDTLFAALKKQLLAVFDQPQAVEWLFDGQQLWLLQTLAIGSLPQPRQAWTRRAGLGVIDQSITPLWYTLQGRWLKTAFWQPWQERHPQYALSKVEPYRRIHSHIYTNASYLRALADAVPAMYSYLPPAWQAVGQGGKNTSLPTRWTLRYALLQCRVMARQLVRWTFDATSRESGWRSLMLLDRLGERVSALQGRLHYQWLPAYVDDASQPLDLSWLCSPQQFSVLQQLCDGDISALHSSQLRPGDDPVHAPLADHPPQQQTLSVATFSARKLRYCAPANGAENLLHQVTVACYALQQQLSSHCRTALMAMGQQCHQQGELSHPDDVFFVYFDELWALWLQHTLPDSVSPKQLATRKHRYLQDAHQGAPDWLIDQVGFGFGGGQQHTPLMRGRCLVAGQVSGPLRRVASAWNLNQIRPGDIVVVDQVDAGWLPWLLLADALVIANQHADNPAASLAVAANIPAVWGLDDAMHSVINGSPATLDASTGELRITP